MFENLSRRLGPTIYVRFTANMLSLRLAGTGKEIKGSPSVALNKKGKAVAAGDEAERLRGTPGITAGNGFSHPRVLIGSFDLAAEAMRFHIKELLRGKLWIIRPIIIMHPLTKLEGGLTQIEERVMKDLALISGAREVYIWEGKELSDKDMNDLAFMK